MTEVGISNIVDNIVEYITSDNNYYLITAYVDMYYHVNR